MVITTRIILIGGKRMKEPKTPNYDKYEDAIKCARHPLVREMCLKRQELYKKYPLLREQKVRG